MDSLWIELLLIVVAILLNGFFAGSEIALVSSRVSRLSHLRDQGIPGAEPALGLKESPEAFLATIQIAITLVGALASAVGGTAAVERLTPWLIGLPIPDAATWAEPVALGLAIIAITYFSLVIGELTPKALAAPSLHLLRGRLPSVVRGLRRYYGPVRLPVVVHHRRVSLDFPDATRPGQPRALPVLARGVSAHARGL